MKTLSEIDTTSKRAARGAGFSWGIAEEVGKNMRLLELFGLSGVKNLNEYFKSYKKENYKSIQAFSETNEASSIPYCPIELGINFLDQITNLEKMDEVGFENMSYPLLFIPFLSRSTEIIGKRIFLNIDGKEFLLNFNQSIYSNFLSGDIIELAKIIKVKFIENKNTFSENEWQELYELSEGTFVEESEQLKKSAAGAGLTDND